MATPTLRSFLKPRDAVQWSTSRRTKECKWTIPSVLTPGKSCKKRRKIAVSVILFNANSKEMTKVWPKKPENRMNSSLSRKNWAKFLKRLLKLSKNTTKRLKGTSQLVWMGPNTTHLLTEQTPWTDSSKNLGSLHSLKNFSSPKIQMKLKRFIGVLATAKRKKGDNFP